MPKKWVYNRPLNYHFIGLYACDGVFQKHVYFECDKLSPTKEQVVKRLEEEYKQSLQEHNYVVAGEESEAMEITQLVDEWSFVSPNGVVSTNTFVEHPKFSKQPYSWSVIKPYVLG